MVFISIRIKKGEDEGKENVTFKVCVYFWSNCGNKTNQQIRNVFVSPLYTSNGLLNTIFKVCVFLYSMMCDELPWTCRSLDLQMQLTPGLLDSEDSTPLPSLDHHRSTICRRQQKLESHGSQFQVLKFVDLFCFHN